MVCLLVAEGVGRLKNGMIPVGNVVCLLVAEGIRRPESREKTGIGLNCWQCGEPVRVL